MRATRKPSKCVILFTYQARIWRVYIKFDPTKEFPKGYVVYLHVY